MRGFLLAKKVILNICGTFFIHKQKGDAPLRLLFSFIKLFPISDRQANASICYGKIITISPPFPFLLPLSGRHCGMP